jgi:hypothetical protein
MDWRFQTGINKNGCVICIGKGFRGKVCIKDILCEFFYRQLTFLVWNPSSAIITEKNYDSILKKFRKI